MAQQDRIEVTRKIVVRTFPSVRILRGVSTYKDRSSCSLPSLRRAPSSR